MTFHLAVTARWMAAQIGDRLTTAVRGQQQTSHDLRANKTLLVYTRNSITIMSVAGTAYLDELPIDQWIAERLIGPSSYLHYGPSIRSGGIDVPNLRWLVGTLTDGITARFSKQPKPQQDAGLGILLNGFTYTRRAQHNHAHSKPIVIRVTRRRGSPVRVETLLDRKRLPWRNLSIQSIGNRAPGEISRLANSCRDFVPPTGRVTEAADIEAMMLVSMRNLGADPSYPTIGNEFMAVSLAPWGQAKVTFHRDETAGGPSHVAYSPWIITRGLSMPPQYMSGMMPTIGGPAGPIVTFEMQPPMADAPGGVSHNTGQPRVPPPGFGRLHPRDAPRAFPYGDPRLPKLEQ